MKTKILSIMCSVILVSGFSVSSAMAAQNENLGTELGGFLNAFNKKDAPPPAASSGGSKSTSAAASASTGGKTSKISKKKTTKSTNPLDKKPKTVSKSKPKNGTNNLVPSKVKGKKGKGLVSSNEPSTQLHKKLTSTSKKGAKNSSHLGSASNLTIDGAGVPTKQLSGGKIKSQKGAKNSSHIGLVNPTDDTVSPKAKTRKLKSSKKDLASSELADINLDEMTMSDEDLNKQAIKSARSDRKIAKKARKSTAAATKAQRIADAKEKADSGVLSKRQLKKQKKAALKTSAMPENSLDKTEDDMNALLDQTEEDQAAAMNSDASEVGITATDVPESTDLLTAEGTQYDMSVDEAINSIGEDVASTTADQAPVASEEKKTLKMQSPNGKETIIFNFSFPGMEEPKVSAEAA
jgi:hypothetical protein